jgi:hypothetical protein
MKLAPTRNAFCVFRFRLKGPQYSAKTRGKKTAKSIVWKSKSRDVKCLWEWGIQYHALARDTGKDERALDIFAIFGIEMGSVTETFQEGGEDGLQFHSREDGSDAMMPAQPESEVGCAQVVGVYGIWIWEMTRVPVG